MDWLRRNMKSNKWDRYKHEMDHVRACVCVCVPGWVFVLIVYESIFQIGEVTKSKGYIRREVELSWIGRSALLTLWRDMADNISFRTGTYNIYAIKASNDIKGQRAYNSTPSTTFEVNILICSWNIFYLLINKGGSF